MKKVGITTNTYFQGGTPMNLSKLSGQQLMHREKMLNLCTLKGEEQPVKKIFRTSPPKHPRSLLSLTARDIQNIYPLGPVQSLVLYNYLQRNRNSLENLPS
jgi:hypothetical protein